MAFSLDFHRVGDVTVVKCTGRLVAGAESAALTDYLDELLRDDPLIVLDLAGVDFMDSSGLGLLVRERNRAQFAGGDLKLCGVPPKIEEVLRITRLGAVFDAHPTETEALAAFRRGTRLDEGTNRPRTDVLCIEPSPDAVAYIGELLKQSGYAILTATNLPDALMLLKSTAPKVVVIGKELRRTRGTWTANTFNGLIDKLPVVELPADFSHRDAGDAGRQLVDEVRALIDRAPNIASPVTP